MTLRIGILGAARITPSALVEPARAVEGVELAMVAARDFGRAQQFAQEHGVPRAVATYDELVHAPDVDAVYNPLPISLHAPWSIAALRAGKHVLCEKPLALNAPEAQRMVGEADAAGRVLMEAFHWRFHPLATRLKELVDGGRLGPLRSLEAAFCAPIVDTNDIRHQFELGGGALMDLGCYPVQWLRFLAGGTPTVVGATAVEGRPGVDVTFTGELVWPSGVTATLHASMAPETETRIGLVARGERGVMEVSNPLVPHLGNRIRVSVGGGTWEEETVAGPPTYEGQLRAFVAAAAGGAPAVTGGGDAAESMQVIDRLYDAAGLPPRGAIGPSRAAG